MKNEENFSFYGVFKVNSSNDYGYLYYLYNQTKICYNDGLDDGTCISRLATMFDFFVKCNSSSAFDFESYMNSSSLDRLNDIEFDCN